MFLRAPFGIRPVIPILPAPSRPDAHKPASPGKETPGKVGGFGNADPDIGFDGHGGSGREKADRAPGTKIAPVIAAIDSQRLRELAGAGAERMEGENERTLRAGETALLHLAQTPGWLERADEDEAIARATGVTLNEDV